MHKTVLLTGGTGYIGSHIAVALAERGDLPVLVDNLSNSSLEALQRIEELAGRKLPFYQLDVCDTEALNRVFEEQKIDACIHLAGYKAVGESVAKPLDYYQNNLQSTLSLLRAMEAHGVNCVVFSSSATVYGTPDRLPLTEDMKGSCTNPYGWTKWMSEQILTDFQQAHPDWAVILLRYFNPIGAHASGRIGENPNGIPNNLMPYISQVAVGRLEKVHVFGDDYDTPDGSGVRDYIHVVDLAEGHCAAIDYAMGHPGAEIINLGTGRGISVLELIQTFSRVNDIEIPYQIDGRRAGDIGACYADARKAKELLNWSARFDCEDMCRDAWNFQKQNPQGY